jgi:molybdopterin converting factor subunit 1
MHVRLRLFAAARDLVGFGEVQLDVAPGCTAGALRDEIARRYPELSALVPHSMLAIDLAFVGDDALMRENCEVALIPPVSGG